MDLEEALGVLGDVRKQMHSQFPSNPDRLAQLDSHIATVEMVVRHLFEEAGR